MTRPTIAEKARNAWNVAEAAANRNLPAPFDISVGDLKEQVIVGLKSPADYYRWIEALGVEADVEFHGSRWHFVAEGHLLDVPVRVFHVMAAATLEVVS